MEMDHITSCFSCGDTKSQEFLNCKDHTYSSEFFTIKMCCSCEFLYTSPRPKEDQLGRFYESNDYISHTNSSSGVFNKLYQSVRKITIQQKVKLLGEEKGSLLELGSGTGSLLHACQESGWETLGVEPSESARKVAKENWELELKEDIKDIEPNLAFDRIMLWHVLEHIPNLNETFALLSQRLQKKGELFIAVPNPNSWDAKHYGKDWAAYDVPRHLYHFTKKSIADFAKNHGLEVIKIKPMIFDSFYVSMLSEKHKGSKLHFIKGGAIGLISNLFGFFTKEFSSHIYILRKKAK